MSSASEDFQRLVDKCLEDGTITETEALLLVDQHNQLQRKSRAELRSLLDKHSQYKSQTLINRGAFFNNSDTRGRMSKNLTPEVQKLDIDHYKDTIKDNILSPLGDEKVRFAVITVPAAFVSLLGFIGVL